MLTVTRSQSCNRWQQVRRSRQNWHRKLLMTWNLRLKLAPPKCTMAWNCRSTWHSATAFLYRGSCCSELLVTVFGPYRKYQSVETNLFVRVWLAKDVMVLIKKEAVILIFHTLACKPSVNILQSVMHGLCDTIYSYHPTYQYHIILLGDRGTRVCEWLSR